MVTEVTRGFTVSATGSVMTGSVMTGSMVTEVTRGWLPMVTRVTRGWLSMVTGYSVN